MQINWSEYRKNWPGRLRFVEARVVAGTADEDELAELVRLLEAREDWMAQGFWRYDGVPSVLHT